MPIVDEIVESETGEVVREEMRMNSGILIKVSKQRDNQTGENNNWHMESNIVDDICFN